MKGHTQGIAPNYTNAFLVSFYVVVLIALVAIWAVWGYVVALFAGFLAHTYLARRLFTPPQ